MKVKFTDPIIQKVKFGEIIEVINGSKGTPELFVLQGDEGGRYIVNPNSDYNFRFIKNEEAEKAWSKSLKELVDKYDL